MQQAPAVATETLKYKCELWTNAGLRVRGEVTQTLSGLELAWTNGKPMQKANIMNPEDKLEFNTTDAKRVYFSGDSTAMFFVKRYQDFTAVLRTLVTVQESKQNRTTCHLDE